MFWQIIRKPLLFIDSINGVLTAYRSGESDERFRAKESLLFHQFAPRRCSKRETRTQTTNGVPIGRGHALLNTQLQAKTIGVEPFECILQDSSAGGPETSLIGSGTKEMEDAVVKRDRDALR